jgi:stress response protein YsnF
MSDGAPPRREVLGALDHTGTAEVQVLALHKEDVAVSKRVRKTLVQATRKTRTRDTVVQEDLHHDQVVVERVAIGRVVDAVPPVRQEGDVTILSVVEEVLVVERRLVLKEEVHLRRVRTTERHVETVALREQDVSVTRTPIEA